MKGKKLFALALVLAMTLSLFAGCGAGGDQNSSTGNDTASTAGSASEDAPELASVYPEFQQHREINITWFEQGWTGPDADLDIIAPEIEKRTNLKMNYEPMTVPTEQDMIQKFNLMVASNEIPDVFFGGIDSYTREIYGKLGEKGGLWDFSEIIKDYPQLHELVEPELALYKEGTGENFFVPTQTGRGYELVYEPPHGPFIRKDFLDKLGMDYPSTPDELYEYLKRATTELEVNGMPVKGILFGENLGGVDNIMDMFLPLIGDRETYTLPFDPDHDYAVKNYVYTNSPELEKAAQFMNKLTQEGLIDSEVLTIKQAQFQEKGSSGQYAMLCGSWWDMNTFSDNAKSEVEDIFWVAPPPIYETKEIEESRNRPWTNWVGCYSSLIVNKNIDEDTLRHLLAVMDYFTTEEGQLLVQVGLEDETYTWNEDGKYQYTEAFIEKTNDLDWNKAAAYGVFYYSQLVNNTPAIMDVRETPPALLREDNKLGWDNYQIKWDAYEADMEEIPLDYYFLKGEVEQEKFQAIKDQKLEFWTKVLQAGSEADVKSIVDEWGATCKSMGIDEIIAERTEIMNRIKEEQGS